MDKQKELTEELKALELDAQNLNFDLKSIKSKLKIAYAYEEELGNRMRQAKQNSEELEKNFFIKTGEIYSNFDKMKKVLDIWTGNFFNLNP